MNKQKRNIIRLQANALKRLARQTKPVELEIRKDVQSMYVDFGMNPRQAANHCIYMPANKQATLLRFIVCYNTKVLGWNYDIHGSYYSVKKFFLATFNYDFCRFITLGLDTGLAKLMSNFDNIIHGK